MEVIVYYKKAKKNGKVIGFVFEQEKYLRICFLGTDHINLGNNFNVYFEDDTFVWYKGNSFNVQDWPDLKIGLECLGTTQDFSEFLSSNTVCNIVFR